MVKNSKAKKQKKLFTLRWTKKHKTDVTKRAFIIFLVILILLPIAWFTNVIPFLYSTVRCGGAPVEFSRMSSTYRLPGDKDYGIRPLLSGYQYCTQAEVEEAGYHRNPFTEAGEKERDGYR